MSEHHELKFTLYGEVDGVTVTPRTIRLSQFNEFNHNVERFIRGTEGLPIDDVSAEVRDGSYALNVSLPENVYAPLARDLRMLEREDSLDEIDAKRADVLRTWQMRAKAQANVAYEIHVEA